MSEQINIRVGQTPEERASQIQKLNQLAEALRGDAQLEAGNRDKAVESIDKARGRLEKDQPDAGRVHDRLEILRDRLEMLDLNPSLHGLAAEVFGAFGLPGLKSK